LPEAGLLAMLLGVAKLPLLAVVAVLIAAVFMGVSSCCCFCFFMPCAACTYMPDATWRTQG
jgi:hypothetical protein